MSNIEQTLSIIKPDAVERNLSEEIKNEFNKNNFKIVKEKKVKLEILFNTSKIVNLIFKPSINFIELFISP